MPSTRNLRRKRKVPWPSPTENGDLVCRGLKCPAEWLRKVVPQRVGGNPGSIQHLQSASKGNGIKDGALSRRILLPTKGLRKSVCASWLLEPRRSYTCPLCIHTYTYTYTYIYIYLHTVHVTYIYTYALKASSAFFQEASTGGSMSTRSGFQHSCNAQAAVLKKSIEVALNVWYSHRDYRGPLGVGYSLLFQRFFISFTTKLP